MTPFVVGMRSRPAEFRRGRSVPLVIGGVALVVVGLLWLGDVAVGATSMATGLGALELAVPAVVILVALGVRAILLPSGPWKHLPSGARMRRIGLWTYGADALGELSAATATGDPRLFLPLPTPEPAGPVWVEAWSADGERLAWLQLVWGATRADQREAPLIEISGDGYTALLAAEEQHALVARRAA